MIAWLPAVGDTYLEADIGANDGVSYLLKGIALIRINVKLSLECLKTQS